MEVLSVYAYFPTKQKSVYIFCSSSFSLNLFKSQYCLISISIMKHFINLVCCCFDFNGNFLHLPFLRFQIRKRSHFSLCFKWNVSINVSITPPFNLYKSFNIIYKTCFIYDFVICYYISSFSIFFNMIRI